ncbi:hypothetical protein EZV62_013838 [Acer yangbiense]|uniref:Uncharacterized protein n=1 Tax=Acer yangbiense TaxID=1000413 RepID=A0A5C7HR41_9ROSI|nr:hypothetical protein EZV62_013838 [Acer yangbiense]
MISTDLSSLSKTSETSPQLLSVAFIVFGSLVFGLPSADSSLSKCDWSHAYMAIGHALTTGIKVDKARKSNYIKRLEIPVN